MLVDRIRGLLDGFSDTPSLGLKAGITEYPGVMTAVQTYTDYYARNGFNKLNSIGQGSFSGERVTVDTALNHSVVFACLRMISEPCAMLPLSLMQAKNGQRRTATEHPMHSALHDEANAEETAMEFRETRTANCVLTGRGFARIVRRSGTGTAIELQALKPSQVETDRDKSGRLVYVVRNSMAASQTFTVETGKPQDIFDLRGLGWDGQNAYSVLSMARHSIGTALAAERNLGGFFANGGRLPSHVEMANKFKTKEDFDKFRADFEGIYRQSNRLPILENDIKLIIDGLSMVDAQMLETRQFTVSEICRWFNISPHMVADLSRATFSNIEQLALEFVKFTLGAWLTRWEQALRRCVLTPQEKAQGYYFRHNVNALLRGDFVSRMAGYASALQNGHKNVDEVRALEDENPLADGTGSGYHIQTNMGTLTPGGGIDPAIAHIAANAAAKGQK